MKAELYSGISLEVVTYPPPDVKELLAATVYGMKGEMQYRHSEAPSRIEQLTNPRFLVLRKRSKLLGTVGILGREVSLNRKAIQSWYVRYLSLIPNQSGAKMKRISQKSGLIKSSIDFFLNEKIHGPSPSIFYSYIEEQNEVSKNLSKLYGFKKIRTLSTFIFSRLSPRKHLSVSKCTAHEQSIVVTRLKTEYAGYNFFYPQTVFNNGEFYLFKKNGKIIAGLKATPVEWEILNVPGVSGWFIQYIFPWIPLYNRLFNSEKMKFAAFEAHFCDEGEEGALLYLMENACAELKLNMGISWVDSHGLIASKIKAAGKPGLLHTLKSDIPAAIIAKFSNLDKEDEAALSLNPAYISALDLS